MRIWCEIDKRMVEDRGLVCHWESIDKSGILTHKEEEVEYRQLSCGHEKRMRKTGKTRGGSGIF